jgi:large subunit ribosomal protein L15
MITTLDNLKDTHRVNKTRNRVGRGIGTGNGKTCGRGHNGMGSRSGTNKRLGMEGGQFPLYLKLPIRGFSRAAFRRPLTTINLHQIEAIFENGELVNEETLRAHGYISNQCNGLKILGDGELTKKVSIEANAFSKSAKEKLEKLNVDCKVIKRR